jgi:hypothetical protein
LPDVLDRVQLRRHRRQEDQRDVPRHLELAGGVPAGAVEQQDSVGSPGHVSTDLVEMKLHRLGIGIGQDKRRSDAAGRTDCPEEIGIPVALVGRLPWPCATPRPLPNDTVLLTDPGFILKPNLDAFALWKIGKMRPQRAREVFLNSSMVLAS